MINFKDTIYYPFVKPKKLLIFLWNLIPITGQFIFFGYIGKVAYAIIHGNDDHPPDIESLKLILINGIKIFAYLFYISVMLVGFYFIPYVGYFLIGFLLFIFPNLFMQFVKTNKFKEGLRIKIAIKTAFTEFFEYIETWFKVLILTIIYLIFSIPVITLIITIPSWIYSIMYQFGQFFRDSNIMQDNYRLEKEVINLIKNKDQEIETTYNEPKVKDTEFIKELESIKIPDIEEETNEEDADLTKAELKFENDFRKYLKQLDLSKISTKKHYQKVLKKAELKLEKDFKKFLKKNKD